MVRFPPFCLAVLYVTIVSGEDLQLRIYGLKNQEEVYLPPGGGASRVLSLYYDSKSFPDVKVCVKVFTGPDKERFIKNSACGTGSPLDFVIHFDKVEDFHFEISVFASEQLWHDGKANLSYALDVKVVPRINQLEPLHPSYHLQAVEPWHSIEDDEVEVAVYDGKLLGARIPFYLNVTVLLRDFPVLPVPFILHGDATLASIKSAMSTITGLPLTCFYLAGDETPENTTAHNLWTVKELQWFFRRASLNLQLVPRNSRAECGYTYFKAGAFDPETVVEYHQSSNSVRRVFAFWLGNTPMSAARAQCFDTLNKTELDVVLVTEATLQLWLLPEAPLHPSFWSLSAAHQADYLRAYFTHFHGGGYTNIKCTSESWLPAVKALEADHSKLGVGYPEIGPEGVTFLFDPALNSMLHRDWASLLGIQAYVFRPRTEFTSAWYHGMLQVMDKYADELLAHPAPHAQASTREGGYPLRWTELLGEVFHPLCHTFRNRLLRTLPVPPM